MVRISDADHIFCTKYPLKMKVLSMTIASMFIFLGVFSLFFRVFFSVV